MATNPAQPDNTAPAEPTGNTWTTPTTASPPVAEPTDGQQDGEAEDETNASTPKPQS